MNYDKIISHYIMSDGWHYNNIHKTKYNNKKKQLPNIKNYIETRYMDSESFKETIYRMYYNIENRPVCQMCGKPVSFVGKGLIIFHTFCSKKCAAQSSETIRKKQESDKAKHNGRLGWNKNTPSKIEKRLNTIKEKYGSMSYFSDKIKQTWLNKYGFISPLNVPEILQKRIETYKKNFGVENVVQSEYYKEHSYLTKKKNKTFNTSKTESKSYTLLKSKYPDIIWQYTSNRYPFMCDFYIPSKDIYIECNYHWTHGKKLFENTTEDNAKLLLWQSKNTKYYNQAIYVWTDLDVRKYNIAKQNNLNYFVFYSIEELENWLNKKGDS